MKSNSIVSILARVFKLLINKERGRSGLLLAGIIANSIVEIFGLAAIIPVIGLVVQPDSITKNKILHSMYGLLGPFGVNTPHRFLIALCVLMIVAFLFKALFGLAVNLFQARFSYSVAHRLSGQMWHHHFNHSLEGMNGKDSGQILSEINTWPIVFAQFFMIGGLLIMTECSVMAFIAIGLLLYNPIVFLSIAALLITGAIFIRMVTKKRLSAYNNIREQLEPESTTLITNVIRGFLEVITFQASDSLRSAYLQDRWTIFRMASNSSVFAIAPAKLYEVLAVCAIASSIIIALLQGVPNSGFLELLSLMAISAYRTMPSMSRLNRAVMHMREQTYVLDAMEKGGFVEVEVGFTSATTRAFDHLSSQIDIELSDVTLGYEPYEKPLIQELSHFFQAGKLHGIVGASGSGKSTLINSILGLRKPISGKINILNGSSEHLVLGENLKRNPWLLNIGYLSQQPFLFSGTLRENLTLKVPGAVIDEVRIFELVERLDLSECLGQNPFDFHIQEGGCNLSGGQQQRIALLRALQVHRPVLILDEATSALDSKLRDIVFELLQERAEQGGNIILVTHDMELANSCDDILYLTGGLKT